jgi:hypothetical protein
VTTAKGILTRYLRSGWLLLITGLFTGLGAARQAHAETRTRKGGVDQGSFDPDSDDSNPKHPIFPTPPPFTVGDVLGAERVKLANFGIAYLQKALTLRPTYPEAIGELPVPRCARGQRH